MYVSLFSDFFSSPSASPPVAFRVVRGSSPTFTVTKTLAAHFLVISPLTFPCCSLEWAGWYIRTSYVALVETYWADWKNFIRCCFWDPLRKSIFSLVCFSTFSRQFVERGLITQRQPDSRYDRLVLTAVIARSCLQNYKFTVTYCAVLFSTTKNIILYYLVVYSSDLALPRNHLSQSTPCHWNHV